jgi:hypothetical protein
MIDCFLKQKPGNRRKSRAVSRWRGLAHLLIAVVFFLTATETAGAGEKTTVGEVEDVILLPWGVKLPARIDTGASQSSLDAQDLKIRDSIAEFHLPKKYGGLRLRLPVIGWTDVRSSEARDRRPLVEMEICFGPRRLRTKVSLNDRSMVTYPFIIGRDILKNNFVVDCTQLNCSPPKCPETLLK